MAPHTPYRRTGDHDLSDGRHLDEGRDGDRGSPAHTAANPGEVVHRYCPSFVGYTGYVIIFESLNAMLARVMTLHFDTVLGGFDDTSLRDFLKDKDVLSLRATYHRVRLFTPRAV